MANHRLTNIQIVQKIACLKGRVYKVFKRYIYYIKVSGIASSNKLIKAIRYPHMWRYDIFTCEDIDDFGDIKFVS